MKEKLSHAFQLAYFILKEEKAALHATREAVAALDVMLVRQDKRIHYLSGHRTKVSLGEWQMLQRLVYFAAEAEERRQEEQGVTESTLALHYLKHLVYITACRNSFFVSLGLCRLLHNYSTSETAQIHELIMQDPDRGRDDSYYRRRKAQLMREIQERFGALLVVQRGARGEERFKALPDSKLHLPLIKAALHEFTPWGTKCCLPAAFNPYAEELPPLRFRGQDPDGEHEVEIRRMHTLLHPDCFERLLESLRLDPSDNRIEVPQFQSQHLQSPPPPCSGRPFTTQLSEEVMRNLKESIAEERERRRRFSPRWLRVVVDGKERARWPVAQGPRSAIEIEPTDKLIEICGERDGEELRLTAHFLEVDAQERLQPVDAALTLEGGQILRLEIMQLDPVDENGPIGTVTVSYREPSTRGAQFWRWRDLFPPAQAQVWRPAMAAILLALLSSALFYALRNGRESNDDDIVRNTSPTPQSSPTIATTPTGDPQPSPTTAPTQRPSPPLSSEEVIAVDFRHSGSKYRTRSERALALGLLEAKKVYLDVSGVGYEQTRRFLQYQLPADAAFNLTDNIDEADVALKATIAAAGKDRVTLTVYLADANGEVIWPLTAGKDRRKYIGFPEKVIAAFSRDLANDLKQVGRK